MKQGSFALLQSDRRNYKMEQLIYYKVGQSLLQWGHVLKKDSFIAKWGRQIGARAVMKWHATRGARHTKKVSPAKAFQ